MKHPFSFYKNPQSSLRNVYNQFYEIIIRFPLAVFFAFIGTFAALQTITESSSINTDLWIKLILCSVLGVVYSIAVTTFAESKSNKKQLSVILNVVVLLLLAAYFFFFPEYIHNVQYFHFALIAAIGHLLVASAPFFKNKNINIFWHYNKSLFVHFLTSLLYSLVLYTGISIALIALSALFDVDVNWKMYLQIWYLIIGVFNTCFFLARIPEIYSSTEEKSFQYPKGLKIFTQFILIPLVSLYIIILLAYELKIIILWELSEGWVANLIIAFAVFGILSLLLIDPIKKQAENKWITLYTKGYYIIIIPIVVLLFVSIYVRINSYGFTEQRFWILIMGIWLLLTAIYFIFSRKANIKLIPLSLIVAGLFALFIAPPLSISSQQNRLEKHLAQNNILNEGKIVQPADTISKRDRYEITSIIKYLYKTYGSSPLMPLFKDELEDIDPDLSTYQFTKSLMDKFGLKPSYSRYYGSTTTESIYLYAGNKYKIETKGYDYFLRGSGLINTWDFGDTTLEIRVKNKDSIIFEINKKETLVIPIRNFLQEIIIQHKGSDNNSIDPNEAALNAENDKIKVKIGLKRISGSLNDDESKTFKSLYNIEFFYLIKFKH